MSELRELLGRMATNDSHFNRYTLLEALVKAVEPEKHTCGECRFFAPSAAYGCLAEGGLEIHRVWDECVACDKFQPKGLEDIDARYAGCKTCDEHTIVRLAYELAEAKAEIRRWEQRYKDADAAHTKAQAEIESLRAELLTQVKGLIANATLGELVRGMADDTKLQLWSRRYRAWKWDYADCKWKDVAFTDDPAEALRSIQASE